MKMLSAMRQWIIDDQYEYGEFGKHETIGQKSYPRTAEISQIKPNVFSSITAYCTLLSTGAVPDEVTVSFHEWLDRIRSDTGYWTSASGKKTPFPTSTLWDISNNLRHTAKCLDYHLLNNTFRYEDALLFNNILNCQLDNGSFPQFEGMNSDLWSTAYFANLLIRASLDQNLKMTLPRDKKLSVWKNMLNNRLKRAIAWLLEALDSDLMWSVLGSDRITVTLAMMIEIGGYLAIHERETCSMIVNSLLKSDSVCATHIYILYSVGYIASIGSIEGISRISKNH